MLAVIPVRDGSLPAGGAEVAAECDGHVLVAGQGTAHAAAELAGLCTTVHVAELGPFRPGAWSRALAPWLADHPQVVLPAAPDGRDLAPRLAHELRRELHAGAIAVTPERVSVARHGGLFIADVRPHGPFVATLQPGSRGVEHHPGAAAPEVVAVELAGPETSGGTGPEPTRCDDAVVLEVLPPDVTTMDLAEAPRIVGGGAGLDSPERFAQLAAVAAALGASMGATRVITDRGWVSHARQIGTTGVVVDPRLYLAFGISGAVQHTSGLGQPDHIVSVNTDPHCPMMQLADLAVVADANAVVAELARRLGVEGAAP
jgi:electron transfer flavoprotein alpha subunit